MRGGEGQATDGARSASLGQNGATEGASDQMRQMETPIIESDGRADGRADGRTHAHREECTLRVWAAAAVNRRASDDDAAGIQ